MTPQEKAKELFNKFHNVKDKDGCIVIGYDEAIQCALIAVYEMMKQVADILPYGMEYINRIDYLEGIKQELIKMQTT